ncbi:MAG: hypothetical protein QM682_06200 [Paracoccus sp. (in: a-proteobacteria)]|uniref:hypothetical protein n=1 Tax=Paracoccus sp. TaxID=267 RepID=UPI0039E2524D
MKFSTREDIDLPAAALFAAITDFPKIERVLVRRGARLRRMDGNPQPSLGNAWLVDFDWRGRARELRLQVTGLAPPERLNIAGASEHFNLEVSATVVALSPSKSRLLFELSMQPRGMKARLMLQTAKLGKGQLDRKFAERIGDLVGKLASGTA